MADQMAAAAEPDSPLQLRQDSLLPPSSSNASEASVSFAKRPSISRSNTADTTDDYADDLFAGLTLLDLLVSVQTHIDNYRGIISDKVKERSKEWKSKATGVLNKRTLVFKDLPVQVDWEKRKEATADRVEREVQKFREKSLQRMSKIQEKWNDSKVVSLRDKLSFLFGVMNVAVSTLLIGFRPQWIPMAYTIQALWLLPVRVYTYKNKNFHYFLLDSCYVINILSLIYLWVFPSSTILFSACYALSHGPLASAVATWRNSLVFHSLDKVTSLFIHMYPAFLFTTLRHFHPTAMEDYPAVAALPKLNVWETVWSSSAIYLSWQIMYYYFVIVKRREKIEKQGRVTSFTYLLKHDRGWIGKTLNRIPQEKREVSFMCAQYVYTVITMLPSVIWFYTSCAWSSAYLLLIFAISVWNGASFYLTVFGRRFEKELVQLRREMEALQIQIANTPNASPVVSALDTSAEIEPLDLERKEQ